MNDRKEYAYLLCIGGKIKKLITVWWSSPQEMTDNMAAMHAAAYAFKKTAAILVYEHKDGDRWKFAERCEVRPGSYPREIILTADNEIIY